MGVSELRNRIVELRQMRASELQDNEGNWRTHPQFQRGALAAVLGEVGKADVLKAYHSERQGGKLTLIDGHLRKADYPDEDWGVLVLDVDDVEADKLLATMDPLAALAEADKLLATMDPLAALAEVDAEALEALIQNTDFESEAIQAVLTQQSAEAELAALIAQVEAELSSSPGDGRGVMGDRNQQKLITTVVWVDDLADFECAILATGLINRGEAVVEIARSYLRGADSGDRQ